MIASEAAMRIMNHKKTASKALMSLKVFSLLLPIIQIFSQGPSRPVEVWEKIPWEGEFTFRIDS